MSKPTLILVGGGGHCRSIIDVIELEGKWAIAGIVDRKELVGQEVLGHRITADDTMLEQLARAGHRFLVTAGQVKDAGLRRDLFTRIQEAGGQLATVVSPLARVAPSAQLGAGTVVCHMAVVNSNARVGLNCIVNTGALVEHDARVGNTCHVATGAIVNGGSVVGDRTFIGSRATLVQAVRVGNDCVIGAGAVVLNDVPDGSIMVGQPARSVR